MKLPIAHSALLLTFLAAAAHGADIYRYTAPDGTVSYSDRPQGPNSEFVVAVVSRPASTPAATGTAPAGDPAPEAAAPPAGLNEGPSAAQLREQRQTNCNVARERLERYTVSRRLFRTNAAGEREYLDDSAVAEARAKAAADVEDWCG